MSEFEITEREMLEAELSRLKSFRDTITFIWPAVRDYYEPIIRDSIKELIEQDDPALRGRIQAMQEFAELPGRVRSQISTVEMELAEPTGLHDDPLL